VVCGLKGKDFSLNALFLAIHQENERSILLAGMLSMLIVVLELFFPHNPTFRVKSVNCRKL